MDVEPDSVDLPKLLRAALRLVSERAGKHRIELFLDIDERLKLITADERKLKQFLFNLLSNAVKFTREGGKVGVRASSEDDSVLICVWDTGIGIPASEQENIFHDFYQVDSSLVRSTEGTGLGLSLVKKIAELHGGKVWVESEVGKGSRFFIRLPQQCADRERTAPSAGLVRA